jgi:hypothetical protein
MCVLSGNFTTLLWQKMLSELDQWNLPSDIALPCAQKTIEMVFRNPDEALSGPFIRGDLETQKKNLAALSGDPYHDVYRAFQQAYMQNGPK